MAKIGENCSRRGDSCLASEVTGPEKVPYLVMLMLDLC